MGFSIGKFIGKIAPFVGAAFGGPIGGAIGAAVGAGFAGKPERAAGIGRQLVPGPVSSFTDLNPQRPFQPAVFRASQIGPTRASFGGTLGRIAAGTGLGFSFEKMLGGGGTTNGSPISQILAKARAATGGPVTRNKIIDAAKVCGLEIAAETFGLEVTEVCMVVVRGRTRRRRGVSAADIRRTKRTIGFASKIRKDLKALAR